VKENQHPVNIFIPARYHSSRFEGKPLADILGKSMIERVYEQASKVPSVSQVTVLTDDLRILNEVMEFGGNCLMTYEDHASGTDRILEVLKKNGFEGIIINLQGDEPLIDPLLIESLIREFNLADTEIVTACNRITHSEDLFDYNVVKVVRSTANHALYFSRNVIPAFKELPYREWIFNTTYYRHIGVYAFRSDVLQKISSLPFSKLEKAENLEQLRWMEAGIKIKCIETEYESIGVDVPDDVEKVVQILVSENIGQWIN
jgi:3-deoxy-manno-octulosonate cytidylyltransferase (CMP-KDO synthetase)